MNFVLPTGDGPSVAPTLQTARLTLRGHVLTDLADCVAMWGDPEVTRYIGGRPSTEKEVWHRVLRYAGHWALLGYGFWVIRETASGRFIGEGGFLDSRRDIPSFDGAPEIGWALARSAHGKGYATEALRAAVDWTDARLGPRRTVCLISSENFSSLRVADKLGYREFERTTYEGNPNILLERVSG